jgi:hypothetical protein
MRLQFHLRRRSADFRCGVKQRPSIAVSIVKGLPNSASRRRTSVTAMRPLLSCPSRCPRHHAARVELGFDDVDLF